MTVPSRPHPDARRAELAAAVWRIVVRDGPAAASVRGVAREAGLSMGSVRHFFATQHELLTFALEEVVTRVTARIQAGGPARERLVQQGRAPEAALALLEEVLPLDDERLTEATVWAAFTAPPLWDPAMAGLRRAADAALGQLCQDCVRGLAALGHVHPDRDQEVESARIHALVDGLTLHRLLDPDRTSAHHVRSVVRLHLADLAAAPTADARNR